jgi:NitT/TauT family transport system permease protein
LIGPAARRYAPRGAAFRLVASALIAAALARALLAPPGFTPACLAAGAAALLLAAAALRLLARADTPAARLVSPMLFGAMLLWLWEMLVLGLDVPRVLLPAPSAIAGALIAHLPTLGADFHQTVIRAVLPGYLLGNAAGFLTALAIDRSDFLRRGLLPLGSLVSAMPIVGIAPILVMWFGFDWQSKAAMVTLITFFPMLVHATAGLAESGVLERDLMRSYAAGYLDTLRLLRLPSAMPFVFTALKLNTTLALIGAVVAEFFGTPILGMGFRISTEAARMNLDIVWATITVAALTGSGAFGALGLLQRAVTFWHPSQRH